MATLGNPAPRRSLETAKLHLRRGAGPRVGQSLNSQCGHPVVLAVCGRTHTMRESAPLQAVITCCGVGEGLCLLPLRGTRSPHYHHHHLFLARCSAQSDALKPLRATGTGTRLLLSASCISLCLDLRSSRQSLCVLFSPESFARRAITKGSSIFLHLRRSLATVLRVSSPFLSTDSLHPPLFPASTFFPLLKDLYRTHSESRQHLTQRCPHYCERSADRPLILYRSGCSRLLLGRLVPHTRPYGVPRP
jgi:hypothetical protein